MSITAMRSTPVDDASSLNFRSDGADVDPVNAIAQPSTVSSAGPKLDNRRVLAGVVDLVIVAIGAAVVLFAGDALTGDSSDVRGALGAVILGWALYYYFALESGHGQTVGKKAMKLRVVRADGRPAGMREIAVRTILRVVDGVGLYIVGLIVMLATGERRQRIGDLAGGTLVVDASAPPVSPPPGVIELNEEETFEEPYFEDEPVEDEPVEDDEPVATATITLPSRPSPPTTLADIAEPAPVVEEPVAEDEAVAEVEPAAEVEPVAENEVEEAPVAEVEPIVEDELLPEINSPAIQELARDVEVAHSDVEVEDEAQVEAEAQAQVEADDEAPAGEEPVEMTVKSVETISAMDLVMGDAPEEDDSSEDEPQPA
jgi:uncharacterized RDD family membrane protein YckC